MKQGYMTSCFCRAGRWLMPFALTASVVLSGCVNFERPAPERFAYDLGGEAVPVDGALSVELSMPPWQDGADILYRLSFDDPVRLRAYAGSRWAGRPGSLIEARLRLLLGNGRAQCAVQVEVEEFSQHFSKLEESQQVLAARWRVVGPKGERLLDDAYRFAVPAPSADARGGVIAAARGVADLAAKISLGAATFEVCRSSK